MKDAVKGLIRLRTEEDTDRPFIYATWLRGLYYGNSFYRQIEKDVFMDYYTKVIQHLMFKPNVMIQVAALKEDADTIIGYSVVEDHGQFKALHWVFVKLEWRGAGIAKDLIPNDISVVTHTVDSNFTLKLKDKAKSDKYLSNYDLKFKNKKLTFNPFII